MAIWNKRVIVAPLVLWLSVVADSRGEPKAEEEYEALRERFVSAQQAFFKEYEKATTDKEREAVSAPYPSNTMVDEFLRFELEHRGTQAGLSALHHLVSQAGGGGSPDSAVAKGRQAALGILIDHYADHPDLDVMFSWLGSGAGGPQDKPFLKRAALSPHRHIRGAALLALASDLANDFLVPSLIDANIALLEKQPEKNREDISRYKEIRRQWDDADPLTSRPQAMELLAEVAGKYGDVLEAPRTPYGPILIKVERSDVDALTEQKRRPISELAKAIEYQLNHLAIGQVAPEIAQPDADGKMMRLSDYRGKAIMLMFSFKGCGPCEAMYPGNRKLLGEYASRPFAVLSVMGDQTVDTVQATRADGTITWPVWWDGGGTKGPLSTRWNVHGWPEMYLIDHRGVIRYRELRGSVLEQAVEELILAAERDR